MMNSSTRSLSFLVFLVLGCTRVQSTEIAYTPDPAPALNSLATEWGNYSEYVDVMMAFLWPENITTDAERRDLVNVLQNSRKIVQLKQHYQSQRADLRARFARARCECAINHACDGTEKNLDPSVCYTLENEIYANDQVLVDVYALVEEVKKGILAINGEWIDTHLDIPNSPSPKIDYARSEIHFAVFGTGGGYPTAPLVVSPGTPDARFTLDLGPWKIEGGISKREYSLLFQGDLFREIAGKKRRGMVYWENPRIETP